MWNVKAKVIPVIIGTTGTISKSLSQYLSNIPGKHEIKELESTAIFCTAHILWKVLMQKYKTYCMGEITSHVAQTVNTGQLQHYIIETWFV
jgi:tRNA(Ile2) C34 agmatinyltransferase TiaS